MNEDDLAILLQFGYAGITIVAGRIIVSMFFGIYIMVSGIAIWILARTGLRTRPQQIALFLQLSLLLNSICCFLSGCAISFTDIRVLLIHSDASRSLGDREITLDGLRSVNHFNLIIAWTSTINLLIADTLVIWRAWAIWRGNKLAQLIWIALGLSNTVFNILSVTIWNFNGPGATYIEQNLYLLISFIVNALATVAIAYKAWIHSRATSVFGKEYQRSSGGRPRVGKILWVVTESGVVFCIIQGAFFAISIASSISSSDSSTTSLLEVFHAIIQPFGIIILPYYPTVVFIVANLVGRF
ncbi:hypothetical protein GYMLUDRAFT_917537 [Collybiopsis luxurians FD-317 M1]|uniref:Uncharacterized protein n=1 Tax=Collybiopsis luxurians FD-317 M1 TaxID=944289 RepID=A0A0D0C891_9AGAR|nr:hypothetical protein GYMLUDRAFT_917537 [Collybiopsis luxurians FD-317 M1]